MNFLLKQYAPVTQRDNKMRTPLYIAIENAYEDIATDIIKHLKRKNQQDNQLLAEAEICNLFLIFILLSQMDLAHRRVHTSNL